MKKTKQYFILNIITIILLGVFSILLKSNTTLACTLLITIQTIILLLSLSKKENTKLKGILTSILGLIILLSAIGIIFYTTTFSLKKPSLLLIPIILITLLSKYAVTCATSVKAYNNQRGLLQLGNVISNFDFIMYAIILLSLIVSKFQKLLSILKYTDMVFTIVVSLYIAYLGLKLINNSFKSLKDENLEIDETIKNEITKRDEVKEINNIELKENGGIRTLNINLKLAEKLSLVDLNTFILTLQDYLLKTADVVYISMNNNIIKKKPKIRSKKQDARDSGSGNSKKNTKKQNSKKKNKKR